MGALGRRLDDGDVARRLQIAQPEYDRVGADRGGDLGKAVKDALNRPRSTGNKKSATKEIRGVQVSNTLSIEQEDTVPNSNPWRPGWQGLPVGPFWKPGDPALISLPEPVWLWANLPGSVVKVWFRFFCPFLAPISASSKCVPSTKWLRVDRIDQHHVCRPR